MGLRATRLAAFKGPSSEAANCARLKVTRAHLLVLKWWPEGQDLIYTHSGLCWDTIPGVKTVIAIILLSLSHAPEHQGPGRKLLP